MGITTQVKQISVSTLELLQQDSKLTEAFFDAQYLPESPEWRRKDYRSGESAESTKRSARGRFGRLSRFQMIKNRVMRILRLGRVKSYDLQALETQFLEDWEVPELDLHKYFEGLSFLLAGYSFTYEKDLMLPELKSYIRSPMQEFFQFLVIDNSAWDGLPLVNAIGAGEKLGYETGYGPVRYLLPHEVVRIDEGLRELTEAGFQERYQRESLKETPCPWIDWSDEDTLEYLTDYYNEMVEYYQIAVRDGKAILIYLI